MPAVKSYAIILHYQLLERESNLKLLEDVECYKLRAIFLNGGIILRWSGSIGELKRQRLDFLTQSYNTE